MLGECEWCGRSIIRSDPFVVEEYNAGLSKRLIHHSPIHDCLEKYWEKIALLNTYNRQRQIQQAQAEQGQFLDIEVK